MLFRNNIVEQEWCCDYVSLCHHIIVGCWLFLPLFEDIAVSDGGTERERCAGAGDAERARCEGARAIDLNLLQMTDSRVNGVMSTWKFIQECIECIVCWPEWRLLLFIFWLDCCFNTFQARTMCKCYKLRLNWRNEELLIDVLHSYHWVFGASAMPCLWPYSSP